MARAMFRDVVTDINGDPIPNVTVALFDVGTSTPIAATIYSAYTGVATLTNPFQSNAQGEVAFFLDSSADVDVEYSVGGFATESFTAPVLTGTTVGVSDHASLSGVTADQHHAQAHAIGGADHTGSLTHAALSSVSADQHHAQAHGVADHTTAVTIRDEGVGQGDAKTFDFVGAGVAAAVASGVCTVTIGRSVDVRKNSTASVFTRPRLNLIEGSNVTLTVADDATDNEVDVTIDAAGGISGTLTASRIPYAIGADTLTDSANLAWDNTNNELELGSAVKLLFGSDTNLFRDTTDTLATDDSFLVNGGYLSIGENDTVGGFLEVFGAGTGIDDGGAIYLHTSADHDTTIQEYRLFVFEDDFFIYRGGSKAFSVLNTGSYEFALSTSSASPIIIGGDVSVFRSAANEFALATGDALWMGTATGTAQYIQFFEQTADPSAGATNTARLFAKDNGAGKTQLVVRFPTGATQVLATEP